MRTVFYGSHFILYYLYIDPADPFWIWESGGSAFCVAKTTDCDAVEVIVQAIAVPSL